jgi:hypothetical protein
MVATTIFVCSQCLRRKPCYLPGSGHCLTMVATAASHSVLVNFEVHLVVECLLCNSSRFHHCCSDLQLLCLNWTAWGKGGKDSHCCTPDYCPKEGGGGPGDVRGALSLGVSRVTTQTTNPPYVTCITVSVTRAPAQSSLLLSWGR